MRRSPLHFLPPAFLEDACFQPRLDERPYPPITNSKSQEAHEPFVAQTSEKVSDIHLQHVLHPLAVQYLVDRCQSVMAAQPSPETERAFQEVLLVDFIQNLRHCPLDRAIDHRRNPDWTL